MPSSLQYLDFDLLLQRNGDHFQSRVLHAPGGEAIGTFEIPFSDVQLENFLLKIGQPRRGTRRLDDPQTQSTKQFGDLLFRAIFNGEVLASFRSSLQHAEQQQRGLRLRLHMKDTPVLAQLPWEYLYSQSLNDFLALCRETPIIRYLELQRPIPTLMVTLPLRVLVIVSKPKGAPDLNSADEQEKLNEALAVLKQDHKVIVEPLPVATLKALHRRLQGKDIHVLHFIGHGGFDTGSRDGFLLFQDERGNREEVTGERLGVLLHNHSSLRLAVINACDGARSSLDDPFAGVAQNLVQKGLPAVIAMQFEISDDAARVFASGFYSAIANGFPVDAALTEARTAIHSEKLGAEWGTPVLFTRAPEGHLFDLKAGVPESGAGGQVQDPPIEPRQSPLLELLSFGLAALSIIASLSWLLYQKEFGSVTSALTAGSRSLAGGLSLILLFASAGAYFLWRKARWGMIPQRSKSARKALLFGVLVGGLGYSATLFSKVSTPDSSEVVFSIVNENTGRPLSSALIKVLAGGELVGEGLSDANGTVHLILSSRLFSSELTFLVRHEGFQDGELVKVPKPGITERIQLLPNASIVPTAPQTFKSTIKFSGLPITVFLNTELTKFNYGYTSLESDATVMGQNVKIKKVQVDLEVLVHSGDAVGNVDVLLGPGPVIFRPGTVSLSHYDNVDRSTRKAPVQAHFVVGRKPIMVGQTVHYYATYDFETRQPGGDSTNRDETDEKDFLAPTINLPKGLFAQVVLWNGSAGGVNEDIMSLSLVVEGTKSKEQ